MTSLRKAFFLLSLIAFFPSIINAFEPFYEPDVPDEFYIQIDKGKANKYVQNFYGGAMSSPIKEKYKGWYGANITIGSDNNKEFYKSKIRLTGDDPKHIDVVNFKASLKIKLAPLFKIILT